MLIQRSLGFFKKLRSYSQFATTAAARSYWTTPTPGSTGFSHIHSGSSTRKKPHWDLMSAIILSGQTAIFLGLSRNHVFAEDASATDDVSDNNKTREYVSGLRRIEDGSVISNSHTSKWRIFTDNGRDLFLKGKLDEAEKYFQLALEEAKEGFGPRDPHVASSCNNLAELYRVRKAFQKAEPLYIDAINILKESFGIDDIRVGAAFHNLGQFYLSQRQLDQARTYYERALKIKGRVLGYGHPDYANTMYHLGTVLHLQGNNKDAEALILESIRILEEVGDGETLTCLRRMKYLSQMFVNSNQLAEAENLQRKVLHIMELSKGRDSLDTVIAAEGLALTLHSLGNLTEARELLERCLDVRKRVLPQEHIQVAANMLHLARIALFNSNHLWRLNVSESREELQKAKFLVDNSIRIAKTNLRGTRKDRTNRQSLSEARYSATDEHVALSILLQSLDFIGLLEVKNHELLEGLEANTSQSEAELALRECISIYKEFTTRSLLLESAELRREYLSFLKRLSSRVNENRGSNMQVLKDEVQHIEAELSAPQHVEKSN